MPLPEHLHNRMKADLEARIDAVQLALSRCESPSTPEAHELGQKLTRLVRQRNDLRTHQETHQIEQQRGIA